ncbi:MAG: DUF262 domain-containing protein [Ignavibacteriae bacterium]|nr:DUF262 domain-containing protein [Ignavibacteriota bacterium]
MNASIKTILDIFNYNRIIEIPFFQRAYVWDEPQWKRFLSDMEFISKCNTTFYLGSVIMRQERDYIPGFINDKRTLIDGQQRLTTLNIFLKVLSLKLRDLYLKDLFRLPMQKNELALLINNKSVITFNRVMNLNTEEKLEEMDNMTRAYTYFSNNIDISKLSYPTILTNVMFAVIDLGLNDDEFTRNNIGGE